MRPAPKKEITMKQNFLRVSVSTPKMTPITTTKIGFRFRIMANTDKGIILILFMPKLITTHMQMARRRLILMVLYFRE
jgi:hypothetical protein